MQHRFTLRKFPEHMVHFIWFTDQKLFTVALPINAQNDRLYVSTTTLKRNVDANRLLRTRPDFQRSLMVSVAVSKLGCTELFVKPGVKVNGEYRRNVLLMEKILPAIWGMSSHFYIFQQDNAPVHRAKDTIALLRRETSSFIHAFVHSFGHFYSAPSS